MAKLVSHSFRERGGRREEVKAEMFTCSRAFRFFLRSARTSIIHFDTYAKMTSHLSGKPYYTITSSTNVVQL